MATDTRYTRLLWFVLAAALLLRLLYAMSLPTLPEFRSVKGGDSGWYLGTGAGFFQDQAHGTVRGVDFYNSVIPTPPLYILFVGLLQRFLPDHDSIVAARFLQCLAAVATIYLAYRIAAALIPDRRAGLFTAALLAFHPAMIIEPANIATEALYMLFLTLGLWLYIEYFVSRPEAIPPIRLSRGLALVLVGLAFGLATLTRAVSLLFPLLLAGHILWLGRRRLIAASRKLCLIMLVVYAATLSTWTIHNLVLWKRTVIVSDQLMAAIWRGFEANDGSPAHNDALLLAGNEPAVADGCEIDCKYQHPTELYVRRIRTIIEADMAGLVALRVSELGYSILQPHGTTDFGDVSVIAALRDWLSQDRTLHGLSAIIAIEGFALKLATWIFHYSGLILGMFGIITMRRHAIRIAPLAGFLLYTIGAHFFLLALPRYLFPLEIVWSILAGFAAVDLLKWRPGRATGSAKLA